MLVINCEIEELEAKLEAFVWDFKIGDNIRYNLGVVYRLGVAHNAGGRFGKPIGYPRTTNIAGWLDATK